MPLPQLRHPKTLCSATLIAAAALAQDATLEFNVSAPRYRGESDFEALPNTRAQRKITAQTLQKKQSPSLPQLLRGEPSVQVLQSGGAGQATSVSVRGADSQHSLLLLDDTEANDPLTPSRSFDAATLDTDFLAGVELFAGPQSVLFGSDALGGVLRAETRLPQKALEARVRAEGGSFGSYKISGMAGQRGDSVRTSLGLLHSGSAGISAADARDGNFEQDAWHSSALRLRSEWSPVAHVTADVAARYQRADAQLDRPFGGVNGDDPNYVSRGQEANTRLRLEQRNVLGLGERWSQRLTAAMRWNERHLHDEVDAAHPQDAADYKFRALTLHGEWRHALRPWQDGKILAGLSYRQERGDATSFLQSPWGVLTEDFAARKREGFGAYAQAEHRMGHPELLQATFSGGARLNHEEGYGDFPTFLLGTALQSSEHQLRASVATAFKAPTLYQLYSAFGNTALAPERAIGLELAYRYEWEDNAFAQIAFFGTWYSELIDFSFVTQKFANAGSKRDIGVELSARLPMGDTFTISPAYTWLREPRQRRAAHAARVELEWQPSPAWQFALAARAQSPRQDQGLVNGNLQNLTLDSYTPLDARAAYQIFDELQLYVRFENFTNTRYQEAAGYGTPGASVFGGVFAEF